MLKLFSLTRRIAASLVCATSLIAIRTLAADADLHIYNTAQLRYSVGGQYFGALSNPTHISSGNGETRFVEHYVPAAGPTFVRTAMTSSGKPQARVAAQNLGRVAAGTIQLEAAKSQEVFDANGDPMLGSGSRILYRIVISGTGAGTATNTIMTDPIPANTTYLANSMLLNGEALTDAADGDGGQILMGEGDIVQVNVGSVSEATGPKVVEFEVLVN